MSDSGLFSSGRLFPRRGRNTLTLGERKLLQKERQKRALAKEKEKRAEYRKVGLNGRGEKYATYNAWASVRASAIREHRATEAQLLDRMYPTFANRYASDHSPIAASARRAHNAARHRVQMNLSNRRKQEYKMEDLAEGEYAVKSYRSFVGFYIAPTTTKAAKAALRSHYGTWYRRYLEEKRGRKARVAQKVERAKLPPKPVKPPKTVKHRPTPEERKRDRAERMRRAFAIARERGQELERK